MNKDYNRFLHLLQCGIWEEEITLPLFVGKDVDWDFIYRQSEKQTVTGVVLDAILRLPQEYQPQRALLLKWCARTAQWEVQNERMNAALHELLAFLEQKKIRAVLLKGQGIATLYPKPTHRVCGDIDLYVSPSDFKNAQRVFERLGLPTLECGEEKHVEYVYRTIIVELHHSVNRFNNPLSNRRFKEIVAGLFPGELLKVEVGSGKVDVLPTTFNAFYLLTHTYYHILSGGVGLRQLCDWALLIFCARRDLNKEEFAAYLNEFHFYRVYSAVAYVAVHYLGLKEECLPVELHSKNACLGEQLMQMIVWGGNFGKYRGDEPIKMTTNAWRQLGNFWRVCVRCYRFFFFCPSESIWFPIQKLRFFRKKQ